MRLKASLVPKIILYNFKCKKKKVTTINGEKVIRYSFFIRKFFKKPNFPYHSMTAHWKAGQDNFKTRKSHADEKGPFLFANEMNYFFL